MPAIRVLIADDHPIFRQGVAGLIEDAGDMAVAGEATTGREAIEACRALHPDIVIMDLQMPEMDGIEATAALQREFPAIRVIVLTTYEGDVHASRALRAGAAGYLLKTAVGDDLVDTIRAVHAGRRRVMPAVAMTMASHVHMSALSEREVQVLELAASGRSNRSIGAQLAIAEDTVKAHMKSILAKLAANDRTEAAMIAIERGIIALRQRPR